MSCRPRGLRSSRLGEVGELADLVDFHGPRARRFAPVREEPGDQFLAAVMPGPGGGH